MADNTQGRLVLAPLSMIVHPDSRVHDEVAVASFLSGRVYIFVAKVETTADVDGVTIRIQGRAGDSAGLPAGHWADIQTIVTKKTVTLSAIALTATEPIGETDLALASDPTVTYDYGSEVYVRDTNGGSPTTATGQLASPQAQGEFHVLEDRTAGPDVAILAKGVVGGLAFEKDSSDILYNDCEVFAFDIFSLGGYSELRAIVQHRGATGSDIHYRIHIENVTDFE